VAAHVITVERPGTSHVNAPNSVTVDVVEVAADTDLADRNVTNVEDKVTSLVNALREEVEEAAAVSAVVRNATIAESPVISRETATRVALLRQSAATSAKDPVTFHAIVLNS
ncbi:hypothetical protein TELCIR_22280, partial [Teladorsagia circumcincta]